MSIDIKSRPVLFTIAWVLQAISLAFLLASTSTFEYKVDKANNIGVGQYMKCPLNGDPGCANSGDLAMVTVSKWASAFQAVFAMGVMAYLSFFGLLHYLDKVEKYLCQEMQKNLYFVIIVVSFISFMGGLYGPILTTWCYEEEKPDLDWGYSMYLHWIQMPFAFFSTLVVAFVPILECSGEESEDKI